MQKKSSISIEKQLFQCQIDRKIENQCIFHRIFMDFWYTWKIFSLFGQSVWCAPFCGTSHFAFTAVPCVWPNVSDIRETPWKNVFTPNIRIYSIKCYCWMLILITCAAVFGRERATRPAKRMDNWDIFAAIA